MIAIIAAAVLAVLLVLAVMREGRRIRRAQEAVRPVGPGVPAAPDNGPGSSYEDWDECELIESLGVYTGPDLDAGLDRLRAAIRDEQQRKGDQA